MILCSNMEIRTTFNLPNFLYRNIPNTIPIKGNGKALGIKTSNGTFYWGQRRTSSTVPSTIYSSSTNGNAGAANSNINDTNANDRTYVGIATTSSNSGIIGDATGFTSCNMIIKY